MTKKFVRSEWEEFYFRLNKNDMPYTNGLMEQGKWFSLFESFEDRIGKLEKNYAAFDRLTKPIDLGSYADQLRQVTEYNKTLTEFIRQEILNNE